MKLKRLSLYGYMIYLMLFGYMIGPALSYQTGLPRIDNPLSVLFITTGIFVFIKENKKLPKKIYAALLALGAVSIWPAIHFGISSLSPTQFMDIMFFMVIPFFFYFFYLKLNLEPDALSAIQKFLKLFVLYITIPLLIELTLGIQFVAAGESLSLEEGTLKGLFFNPNNLATAAICLAPAILFFYQLEGKSRKETMTGWLLFLMLGMTVFASVSRTAIGCYMLILFIYIVYRKNSFITILITGLMALFFSMMPSQVIQEFLLSLNGNQFLERFSSRVYLFLYDLGSDNSVSYRQEIYNYFWQNPPFLLTGYGPKNFYEYFGGHLSNSLGFENPHSFIIELYLGFGIVSTLGFITYAAIYLINITTSKHINTKSKVIAYISMGVFLLAGFIPSSILRMPFIWLPCFLIFIYSVCIAPKIKTV